MTKPSDGSKKNIKKIFGWRLAIKKIAYRLADSSLAAILLVSSFIIGRWWINSDFSYPSEIILPLVVFAVLTSIFFYIYRWVLGPGLAAHVAALALGYYFYAYNQAVGSWVARFALKLLPDSWTTELAQSLYLLVLMFLLFGAAGWGAAWLVKRYKHLRDLQPLKVILFAVVFIFAVQALRAGNRLWDIRSELAYRYPAPTVLADPAKSSADKPDIYFLMPEDYADANTLDDVNQYDNSNLLRYLAGQGFTNRQPVAYANYPFTMSSLASNLSMSYFPEFEQKFGNSESWQTGFPYRSVINDPPIAQILKQNGYRYNQVSSWWDFTRINIKADSEPSKGYRFNFFKWHFSLSDLSRDMINKSIVFPWLKKGLSAGQTPLITYDRDYNPRENLEAQISSIKDIAGRPDKSVPQFTFGHFMVPHTPFIFNADGSMAEYDSEHNDEGAPENQKYANQVAYFNTRLQELVSYIRTRSPNAVIIIQSDEGSYPPQFRYTQTEDHFYNPINLPVPDMKQKFSILASYRLPGLSAEQLKQLSSPVNTFRIILNDYLGYSLPMLPDCYFATGNKFVVYDYQSVTDKLTGKPAPPACQKYQ